MDGLRQSGSLKTLFPRGSDGAMQAVLVNTAGGVTGGDQFTLSAEVASLTQLTLTTQTAERAYRALPGQVGSIENRIHVHAGARVNWLPQETILFQNSALHRKLSIEMEEDARILLVEPLVFGRTTRGESLTDATLHDRIEIRRDGIPHFLDAVRMEGDLAAQLAHSNVAAGALSIALVLYVAPDAEAHLAPIRHGLPPTAGASLIHSDTLLVRILAIDSFDLRRSLVPLLNRLSHNSLPRPWMI